MARVAYPRKVGMGKRIGSIWRELRRRRVVSTAAAYAAGAFVLLQLAEILFPAFGQGDATMRVLLALLLAGFPVVLGLSWVYDVTRTGLRRTASEEGELAPPSPVLMGAVLIASVLLGGLGWFAVNVVPTASHSRPVVEGPTIAVLPFADLSSTGDQAFLGDGIAEEVLNLLASVDGLHVAARTSSFAFREDTEDAREIGRRLGVANLVEGSIRRDEQSNRVRITAQLIDTETGFHLWSGNFDAQMEDLFAVQDSIAQGIVTELLGRLEIRGGAPRHVAPQAAQDAYWKGRAAWNRRGATAMPTAIGLFQEAVALDPEYAQAYAGLADSYALLPQYAGTADPSEEWTRAEDYARTAIELDSTLAEPHASLGLVRALQGDRAGALASLGRAIRLNPSYAPAFHWRANVRAEMGLLEAAREDAAKAASLDPLSAAIATDYGNILLWDGDVDAAAAEFERALEINFSLGPAHYGTVMVAAEGGEQVKLHMALAQWAAVAGVPSTLAAEVASAILEYRETGRPAEVPAGLTRLGESGAVPAGTMASLHALLGARDEALEWLARSVDDRSWVDQYLAVNTVYEPLRDTPEFQAILERVAGI